MTPATTRPGRSWSGTVDYGPGPLHRPRSVAELRSLVAAADRVRALGTRHSFSEVAVSDAALVSLEAMPAEIGVDAAARTVRVAAGLRYGTLALELDRHGLALATMGSLPHISVGGASSTGTHGSGDGNRSLAAAVRAIDLVTADGDLVTLSRDGDPEIFGGAVLALGALGVMTHLTLDVVPAFMVRQRVYRDLPAQEFGGEGLDAILAGAYSVSLFHHWEGHATQIWAKRTAGEPEFESTWHGARLADRPMHPLPGLPGDVCTDQSGEPGPALERLPHFRMEFTPSNGAEIQSEYYVPREQIAQALATVMPLGERIRPLLHASEVRTVAADDLWLSPAYGRDSGLVHFTWKQKPAEVAALLPEIEAALAPFGPRPHWGKVFTMDPETVRAAFPRLEDWQALRKQLDPRGVFANAYVERYLGE